MSVLEITAGHRSLSSTISCVIDRIRFLPVTMTGRFSNFTSISYAEDRHELRVTGTKWRLPDIVSGASKIFISGAVPLPFLRSMDRDSTEIIWNARNSSNFLKTDFLFSTTLSSLKESLNPSAQSDNNPTIVDQVIVLGATVGSLRYSSGVSGVYFVNLYSFTPLPL